MKKITLLLILSVFLTTNIQAQSKNKRVANAFAIF